MGTNKQTMAGSPTRAFNATKNVELHQTEAQSSLSRLLAAQNKKLEELKQRVGQLCKYKDDFDAVRTRLVTLPDRLSHEVMVPLGKVAFVPGRLKHTNEILVLLGDNWFAGRSARQSLEIVDRRIEKCDELIKGINAEIQLQNDWEKSTKLMFNDLIGNKCFDSFEEEDQGWRDKHAQKVKEYKTKLAESRQKEQEARKDESDVWSRLDELEIQEELQHELDLLGEEEEEDGECCEWEDLEEGSAEEDAAAAEEDDPTKESRRGVTWSEKDSIRQFGIDEILSKRESVDCAKIHFKHTPLKSKSSPLTSDASISSPSDIFDQFCAKTAEPKSILKVKKSTTPLMETQQKDAQDQAPPTLPLVQRQHQQITAVGDEVKEHEHEHQQQQQQQEEVEVNTHRPVSRFKAARLNRKL